MWFERYMVFEGLKYDLRCILKGNWLQKLVFFKKNEEYVLIRAVPSANIIIWFYIIIISKWKRNTDVVEMRYTACKTLCYHWDFRLNKKERTQEVSIGFAAMKEFDPDLKMYIPFEKNNFSWWKVWSVYKTTKKIFRCQCEKDMIEWGLGNKHTPERDRRSRSVYKFLLLRYLADFLTELFSKNVTFGARVCPPVGAGV